MGHFYYFEFLLDFFIFLTGTENKNLNFNNKNDKISKGKEGTYEEK